MTSRIERLLIALMFALLAAGVTLVIASAQGEEPPPVQTSPDCVTCHTESQVTWQDGAHGKAEVVTCEACHGSAPADHPKASMPVNRSPELCVSCHSDARFGVEDWQASKHYQLDIDCATCHDPHSTALKKTAGPRGEVSSTDDVSGLCINCHKDSSMNFPYSTHSQQGVTCVDCHVNHIENADGTPGTVTNHTFNASLQSCNTCHADQMHSPTDAQAPAGASAPSAAEAPLFAVTPEPEPISPMGFSALAGLIGLAGGMVIAPWLERWYRRTLKHEREEDNE